MLKKISVIRIGASLSEKVQGPLVATYVSCICIMTLENQVMNVRPFSMLLPSKNVCQRPARLRKRHRPPVPEGVPDGGPQESHNLVRGTIPAS